MAPDKVNLASLGNVVHPACDPFPTTRFSQSVWGEAADTPHAAPSDLDARFAPLNRHLLLGRKLALARGPLHAGWENGGECCPCPGWTGSPTAPCGETSCDVLSGPAFARAAAVDTIETLGQARNVLGRNTFAGIGN
jgi:hypothetical protein